MPRIPIPITVGHDAAASKFVSSRTLVNSFVEEAFGRQAVYGGPGFNLRQTLATGPVRGLWPFGSDLLAVGGNRLYTVTEAGVATDRGQINGASPVVIADNGLQAVVVAEDANKSYAWDGVTLAEITDPDLQPLSSATFLDQYIIGSIKNSGRFQISALADAVNWDALDIATAETRPDKLRRVYTDNRDLLLLGESTIEGQYNAGGADFPFSRSQLFFEVGLAGVHCIAPVDNTVAFLAVDKGGGFTVRAIRGGTAVIISTPAIAHLISQWSDPGAAQAFSYSLRNHQFWVLRHADGCVVWDAAAPPGDQWHVRQSYGSLTWRPAFAAHIWNSIILGDAATGALYTLDIDAHTEAGQPLVRSVQTEPLGPGRYFTLNEVELMVEPGVGLLTGQGSDPEVWLELSRNGGKTWGARMTRKLGKRGDYDMRVMWGGGFGQFRPEGGVVRFGVSDPVALAFKGAFADYTEDNA